MNRNEAIAAGVPRYTGSICAKHPHIEGIRYVANWGCVSCRLDSVNKYLSNAHGQQKSREWATSDVGRTFKHAQKAKYRATPKAAATETAYRQSEKVRDYNARRAATPEHRQYMAEYIRRPAVKAKRKLDDRVRRQRVSKKSLPLWADLAEIGKIYAQAREQTRSTGVLHVVDHIIPLNGRGVSGLHVQNNLRVVPWYVNAKKGNRLEGLIG